MLIATGLMPHLLFTFDHIDKGQLIPLKNPYKLQRAITNAAVSYHLQAVRRFRLSHWKGHIVIVIIGVLSSIYQILFESVSILDRCVNALIAVGFGSNAYFIYAHKLHSVSFASFINQLLEFERRNVDPSRKNVWLSVKYGRIVIFSVKMFFVTHHMAAISLTIGNVIWPNTPWSLIPHVIYQKIAGFEVVRRFLIFLFTYVSLKTVINVAILNNTVNFLVSLFALNCGVILLEQRTQQVTRMYREMQLMCGRYNSIHKSCFIPQTLIMGVSIYFVSLATLVSAWSNLDVKAVMIFSNSLGVGTGIILLCFHLATRLHEETKLFLKSRSHLHLTNCRSSKRGIVRRYWKSFPVLKIYFFETNFFERETPLVILDFAMNLAVSLILLHSEDKIM